jgi:hypothetical protein
MNVDRNTANFEMPSILNIPQTMYIFQHKCGGMKEQCDEWVQKRNWNHTFQHIPKFKGLDCPYEQNGTPTLSACSIIHHWVRLRISELLPYPDPKYDGTSNDQDFEAFSSFAAIFEWSP